MPRCAVGSSSGLKREVQQNLDFWAILDMAVFILMLYKSQKQVATSLDKLHLELSKLFMFCSCFVHVLFMLSEKRLSWKPNTTPKGWLLQRTLGGGGSAGSTTRNLGVVDVSLAGGSPALTNALLLTKKWLFFSRSDPFFVVVFGTVHVLFGLSYIPGSCYICCLPHKWFAWFGS